MNRLAAYQAIFVAVLAAVRTQTNYQVVFGDFSGLVLAVFAAGLVTASVLMFYLSKSEPAFNSRLGAAVTCCFASVLIVLLAPGRLVLAAFLPVIVIFLAWGRAPAHK